MKRLILLPILTILVFVVSCRGPSIPTGITNAHGSPIAQSPANFEVDGKILFVKDGVIHVWSKGATKTLSPQGRAYEDPAWSPDGRKIAAVDKGQNHSELMTLSADGRPETQLTKNLSNFRVQDSAWARKPAWSPDGTKIAYATDRGTARFGLWITDIAGTSARHANYQPLGVGDVDSPSWSRGGNKIAFVAFWNDSSQLYVLDLNAGGLKKLTDHKEGVYDAAWSPDGARIAYAKRLEGKHDLWVIDPNGGSDVRLTGIGTARSPAWSPDSQMIAFTASEGQGFDLYVLKLVMNSGGVAATKAKQLTRGQNIDATAGISWTR